MDYLPSSWDNGWKVANAAGIRGSSESTVQNGGLTVSSKRTPLSSKAKPFVSSQDVGWQPNVQHIMPSCVGEQFLSAGVPEMKHVPIPYPVVPSGIGEIDMAMPPVRATISHTPESKKISLEDQFKQLLEEQMPLGKSSMGSRQPNVRIPTARFVMPEDDEDVNADAESSAHSQTSREGFGVRPGKQAAFARQEYMRQDTISTQSESTKDAESFEASQDDVDSVVGSASSGYDAAESHRGRQLGEPEECRLPSRTPSPPPTAGLHPFANAPVVSLPEFRPALPIVNTFIHYDCGSGVDEDECSSGGRSTQTEKSLGSSASAPTLLMQHPVFELKPRDVGHIKPSEMDLAHAAGVCTPCAYFHQKEDGCRLGKHCKFCHLCPTDAVRKLKKEKIKRRQLRRQELCYPASWSWLNDE